MASPTRRTPSLEKRPWPQKVSRQPRVVLPNVSFFVQFTILLCLLARPVATQSDSSDICSCTPSVYEFILDFDLTCSDASVDGDGVSGSACVLDTDVAENVTDLVPVRVTAIQILELNQTMDVVNQRLLEGDYLNGGTFRYVSFVVSDSFNSSDTGSYPKGLQMVLKGFNAAGQEMSNFWLVLFSNECTVYPVLEQGQRNGWAIFVRICFALCIRLASIVFSHTHACLQNSLLTIPEEICPLAAVQPTYQPSQDPGSIPQPTPNPTKVVPVVYPTLRPNPRPTLRPQRPDFPTKNPAGPTTHMPTSKKKGKGKGGSASKASKGPGSSGKGKGKGKGSRKGGVPEINISNEEAQNIFARNPFYMAP
jgi:hypothetical protein